MGAGNTLSSDDPGSPRLLARAGFLLDPSAAVVLVSGGFDPIHEGHIALLRGAATYGNVYVALNSDAWLLRKKGYAFQRWGARAAILRECRSVSGVMMVRDEDGTVCDALRELRPDYFANGGDRTGPNLLEAKLCEQLHIAQLFGVGGRAKLQSSSALVERHRGHNPYSL